MNAELLSLYTADRQERVHQPAANTPGYKAMRARDLARRTRVMEIAAAGELPAAEDYYHAAWIMNHGDTPDDARHAHQLALRSSELGHWPARWLAAASYDRGQMYQGRPQKYGTNYFFDGRGDRLWEVDPATTDEERAAWDVPSLAEQRRKAEEANRHRVPLSAVELREFEANAPGWCREAIRRGRPRGDSPGKGGVTITPAVGPGQTQVVAAWRPQANSPSSQNTTPAALGAQKITGKPVAL